jgi:hypothetical protein
LENDRNQENGRNPASDEIDIVDIMAFLWRIRYMLLIGIVAGASLGLLFGKLKSAPAGYYVSSVVLSPAVEEDNVLPVASQIEQLNKIVTTPASGRTLFEGVAKELPEFSLIWLEDQKQGGTNQAFNAFMKQQKADKGGVPRAIEFSPHTDQKSIVLTLSLPKSYDGARLLEKIIAGVNALARHYKNDLKENEKKIFEHTSALSIKKLTLQAEISARYYRLIQSARERKIDISNLFAGRPFYGAAEKADSFDLLLDQTVMLTGILTAAQAITPQQADKMRLDLLTLRGEYQTMTKRLKERLALSERRELSEYQSDMPPDLSGEPQFISQGKTHSAVGLMLLGAFLGAFGAGVMGSVIIFFRANWSRLRAAASKKPEKG